MNKLTTCLTLIAGLLLTSACGVAPSGPSEVPSIDAQASVPAASSTATAQTSSKNRGTLPVPCAVDGDLILEVAARDGRSIEVSSNYARTERGCPGLVWEFNPREAAKELLPESVQSARGEGLRLFHETSTRRGVLVIATAPDGQIAKLRVDFHQIAPSGGAPSATAASTGMGQTSRTRQILPSTCAVNADLSVWIAAQGKGTVEVASNYLVMDLGCPTLQWTLSPNEAAKELTPETFSAPKGEGLRIFTGNTTLRSVWVIATAPDGQVAKLKVTFGPSVSSR